MATLEIRILQPRDFYRPGMWIEGVVLMQTSEHVKARAVRLQFFGEENTRFKVGDDQRSETHELVNAYLTLWGLPKSSNKETPRIPPGSYAFPFCVRVPTSENLPNSYEDTASHIRYMLKAYIDIPFAVDVEWKCPIQVVNPKPLGDELLTAVEQEFATDVGCCCPEGVVQGRIRINRGGAHIGERINFVVELTNRTQRTVVGCYATFKTVRTHRAHVYTNSQKHEHALMEYALILNPGESFSNFHCLQSGDEQNPIEPGRIDMKKPQELDANRAKLGEGETQDLVGQRENDTYKDNVFSFVADVPPEFAIAIETKLIKAEHQLEFRAVVDGMCTNDLTMLIPIKICDPNPCCDDEEPPAPLLCPALANSPDGRTGVELTAASKGVYHPQFSFDGLDYDYEDQFNATKMVSYPVFYDEQRVLPAQLRAFNPVVYHFLLDGVLVLQDPMQISLHVPNLHKHMSHSHSSLNRIKSSSSTHLPAS